MVADIIELTLFAMQESLWTIRHGWQFFLRHRRLPLHLFGLCVPLLAWCLESPLKVIARNWVERLHCLTACRHSRLAANGLAGSQCKEAAAEYVRSAPLRYTPRMYCICNSSCTLQKDLRVAV